MRKHEQGLQRIKRKREIKEKKIAKQSVKMGINSFDENKIDEQNIFQCLNLNLNSTSASVIVSSNSNSSKDLVQTQHVEDSPQPSLQSHQQHPFPSNPIQSKNYQKHIKLIKPEAIPYMFRYRLSDIRRLQLISSDPFDHKVFELLKNKLTKTKSHTCGYYSALKNEEKVKRIIREFKSFVRTQSQKGYFTSLQFELSNHNTIDNNVNTQECKKIKLQLKEVELLLNINPDKFNEQYQMKLFKQKKTLILFQNFFQNFYRKLLLQNLEKSEQMQVFIKEMLTQKRQAEIQSLRKKQLPLLLSSIKQLKMFFKSKLLPKISNMVQSQQKSKQIQLQ